MPIENKQCPNCDRIANFAWVSKNTLKCEHCGFEIKVNEGMVKCIDCQNLLQRYMRECKGEIIEPSKLLNCFEFLSTWDFECDITEKILSRTDIETKRYCEDFEPIE